VYSQIRPYLDKLEHHNDVRDRIVNTVMQHVVQPLCHCTTMEETDNTLRKVDVLTIGHWPTPDHASKSQNMLEEIFMDATAATRLGPFLGRGVVTKLNALVLARPASDPFMVLFTGAKTKKS